MPIPGETEIFDLSGNGKGVNLSLSITGSGLTVEQVQDIVAGMITPGSNINVSYDDFNGKLTINSIGGSGGSGGGGGYIPPVIDISGLVSHPEGNAGATAFVYTLTRTGDLTLASSVDWIVTGQGAAPANATDFVGAVLPSGTANFAIGSVTATITVNVAGDATVEPDESFIVTISNPVNAIFGNTTQATGIITNEDATGAPILSLVTATGTAPTQWKLTPTASLDIGTFAELEVVHGVLSASDAIFAAGAGGIGSNGVTDFQTYLVMMQGQDWESGSGTLENFIQPQGAYTVRARYRTNPYDPPNSIDSAWSNKISDTIVSSVAIFAHTTATDFKNTLTFTNNFLSIQGGFQGAQQSSRTTVAGNDKGQAEFTINSLDTGGGGSTLFEFGFENGTTDFSAFDARPGISNSAGVTVAVVGNSNVVGVNWNSGGSSQAINAANNHQVGDTFSIIPNRSTNALKVYRTRGGVSTLLGTVTVAGLSGFTRAWAGLKNDEKLTGNFGATAFAHALDVGDTFYG